MTMARIRSTTSPGGFYTADRLRGNSFLGTAESAAEITDGDAFMTPTVGYGNSFSAMNGFGVGNDATRQLNQNNTNQLAYAFQRAPGFFDEVCYTGTGANRTVNHNLGVVPELIIAKQRNTTRDWPVYSSSLGSGFTLLLNSNAAQNSTGTQVWNGAPTSSTVSLGTSVNVNESAGTYVAYLFASAPGVSKVGSYTGTGATQVVNCGFAAGARFVLIRRYGFAITGDWYVWDSARGIVAGNDSYLLLNTTAAEVTGTDWVDTAASGFELSNAGGNNVNINGASYIFLSVA
jgi:hypothetical protein